jgi:DNA-binding MarR family transcriptional regulator
MEAQGLVLSHRGGRTRRYFPNDRAYAVRAEGIGMLRGVNARALAELVRDNPGSTQEELVQRVGLSKSVVSKYAKRLEEANLVRREVGRNCLRLYPTGELQELLHATEGPRRMGAEGPAGPPPASLPGQGLGLDDEGEESLLADAPSTMPASPYPAGAGKAPVS